MNATPAPPTVLSAIDACGVVAIVRGAFLDRIDDIVEALVAGGIRAIEVSLTSPDAHAQIARAVKCAGARACGAPSPPRSTFAVETDSCAGRFRPR